MIIKCPYCLNKFEPPRNLPKNTAYRCPNKECNTELSWDYCEDKKAKRVIVGLVGFTGHGKTCYLTSLFYTLKFLTGRYIWGENFSWLSLDDNTHKIIYKEHVKKFEESQLPDSTPENFPHPALIHFEDIPFFGDYFLSFYDISGTVYEETEKITDKGRFVAHSNVLLFILSISNCGDNIADTMKALLDTYIRAVYGRLHINLKKNQHIIVVLTKAEEIPQLLDNLKMFLQEGSYKWYKAQDTENINDKLTRLRNNSKVIEKWLREKGCGGFITLARKKFKSVEYTLVSSTGATPVGKQLATKLEPEDPKRVLDPFLWVLEKTRPKGLWERIFGRS